MRAKGSHALFCCVPRQILPAAFWTWLVSIAVMVCVAQAPVALQPQQARLTLLDGSSISVQSLAIQNGTIRGEGAPPRLTIDDLRSFEFVPPPQALADAPSVAIELVGGSRIFVNAATVANERCQVTWAAGPAFSLPLDALRAIRLHPQLSEPELEKALAAPSAEFDRLFLREEAAGGVTSIQGTLESLDADELKIDVRGKVATLPRGKAIGLVIAQPAYTANPAKFQLAMADGSLLIGDDITLLHDQGSLQMPVAGRLKFNRPAIARAKISSSRVAYLSDLKPLSEENEAIVTLPQPARRDKSVAGHPLRLGDRSYEKGLGVHARSTLTFATDSKWDSFAATIGLDATTGRRGDCIFQVMGDGQQLFARQLKGSDLPQTLEISISDCQRVTLQVEPGEGLDLGDHANWCDARFLKKK
jgi:hypothetical protein